MADLGEFGAAVQADSGELEVREPDTITWYGEKFEVRSHDEITVPLMEYAYAARRGVDSGSVEGLAVIYSVIRGCLAPAGRDRFFELATDNGAGEDQFWPIVLAIVQASSARPTLPPSDSSAGRPSTGPSSKPEPGTQEWDSLTPRQRQVIEQFGYDGQADPYGRVWETFAETQSEPVTYAPSESLPVHA